MPPTRHAQMSYQRHNLPGKPSNAAARTMPATGRTQQPAKFNKNVKEGGERHSPTKFNQKHHEKCSREANRLSMQRFGVLRYLRIYYALAWDDTVQLVSLRCSLINKQRLSAEGRLAPECNSCGKTYPRRSKPPST